MIKTLAIGAIATIALTGCGGDTTDTTDDYAPLMQAAENCQDATDVAYEVATVDQIIDTYTVCHDAYANLETGNDNVDAAITDVYRAYNTARVTAEWSAP